MKVEKVKSLGMSQKHVSQEESKEYVGINKAKVKNMIHPCIEESKEPRKKKSFLRRSESFDIALGTDNNIISDIKAGVD